MGLFYMINSVTLIAGNGPQKFLPGTLIDDTKVDITLFTKAGAQFAPATDAGIAAAAARAQSAKLSRAANEFELESIMRSGLEAAAQRETESFAGAATPAKGVSVHAQVAAGAPVNISSAFTIPLPRRSLQIVVGAGGVACTATVVGTAIDGTVLTKTVAISGAGTFDVGSGADVYETVTSVKTDIDPGGTFDLKTGDGIGLGEPFMVSPAAIVSSDGVVDGSATLSPTTGGFKSSTAPNGTHSYTVEYTAA